MKGIVDRIEKDIVVCEMDKKQMIELPISSFSKQPKSGDVFECDDNQTATILDDETLERKTTVQSLFDKLKKK